MQYAEVVPNIKTDFKTRFFTYKIPPEFLAEVRKGSLVQVPLGKRKTDGIIIKIARRADKKIGQKLKAVSRIIFKEPVIDETRFKLAEWLSEYYLAPFSLCLFEMISLPPKKILSSLSTSSSQNEILNSKLLFSIIHLCQRAILKNKQVIILFPEVSLAEAYFAGLKKKFEKVALYHGGLKKGERFEIWRAIKNGRIEIVVGSHLALFSPLPRPGLIIINDEESDSYKNERVPRYHIRSVAQKLAHLTKAKLILISPTPSVESYFQSKKTKAFYFFKLSLPSAFSSVIIDMKKNSSWEDENLLSQSLRNILRENYQKNGQAILFVNRRGAASYIFCKNCGYVAKCPDCDTPLAYHFSNAAYLNHGLFCHHCSFKIEFVSLCPNCQKTDLSFWGAGVQNIEAEIKRLFIKPQILRIDKDYMGRENRPDFIIGTQKLIRHWLKPVNLLAIVSIDHLLNLPDFRQEEKVFSLIYRLKSLAREKFLIQTYQPENSLFQITAKENWQEFYRKELENRKKLDFPPFSRLIKIIHQHRNPDECREKAEMFAQKLKSFEPALSVLGASPCFYHKIRGKYRWQILIKIQNSKLLPLRTVNLLKTLSSNWIIDVEPSTIL